MTTDRGRLHALTSLIDQRDAGGYTLPAEVLDAHAVVRAAQALAVEQPQPLHVEAATSHAVDDLFAGRSPDLHDLAKRLEDSVRAQRWHETALRLHSGVVEQATSHALLAAIDHADRIIIDHLRPAFTTILEQTSSYAAVLAGQPLDHRSLVTASAKVRTAWTELQHFADRYHLLRQARCLANVAGLRTAQHDTAEEFATLADPHALTGHTPGSGARAPQVDIPADPVDRMLWLVGPAAPARPWLPTTAEQDTAWWNAYGQGVTQRHDAAGFAESVGARGSFLVGPTAA